jgi:hypothetical protein
MEHISVILSEAPPVDIPEDAVTANDRMRPISAPDRSCLLTSMNPVAVTNMLDIALIMLFTQL